MLQEGLELEEDKNAYRSALIGHEALLSKEFSDAERLSPRGGRQKMKRAHSSQSISSGRLSRSASVGHLSPDRSRRGSEHLAVAQGSSFDDSSSSDGAHSHRSLLSRADIEGIEQQLRDDAIYDMKK